MQLRRFIFLLIVLSLSLVSLPAQAQDTDDLVTLQVSAAYNRFFRPNFWIPLQIQVRNDGTSVHGRISVRPETTGRELETAFSTPIDLPTGSEKTIFLYIQAKAAADRVLVELITDDGVRVAERLAGLSSVHPHDALHVVVSGTAANNLTLNGVAATTFTARQIRWEVGDVPPQYQALMALNTIILYDVNSEDFTVGQRNAIEQWVSMGGHLIVIGGPSWTQTATGLNDWLPFLPTSNQNVDELDTLNSYLGVSEPLSGRTFVTTGNVNEDAQVLTETEEGLPLLIRGEIGLGTVDYVTVDPTLEPLRSWEHQQAFWLNLISTRDPQPGWTRGVLDRNYAARAVAILPGIDLLPSVISMIGFILAYILLIGPVNYWLLSKINRRALAWLTIPLLIGVFTTLSWGFGFNLRGSEVIVSRQFIVQSFAGQDVARQDELIGIFSPRRATYTISAPSDTFLQVLPSLSNETALQPGIRRSTVEIVQSERFVAEHVAIDGGIFANFAMMNTVEAPAIHGTINLSYNIDSEMGGMLVRGVVRNDSDITLEDAVIFTGNQFYRLAEPLAPDSNPLTFDTDDFTIIHAETDNLLAMASPLESSFQLDLASFGRNSTPVVQSVITSQVFLGTTAWSTAARFRDDISFNQEANSAISRRRALLFSFMRDQYAAGSIANRAFIIGWSDQEQADDIVIEDSTYRVVDTSLYIIELDTELEPAPSNETMTIGINQFTWSFRGRDIGQTFGGLNDLTIINPGWAELRFIPLSNAVLDDVSLVQIELDRSSSYGREMGFAIWNWETETWFTPQSDRVIEVYEFENPTAYLGPNNAVDIRFGLDRATPNLAASVRIKGIRLTQTGTFE